MKTQTTVVLVALLVACVTVQTGSSYSELERYHLINSECMAIATDQIIIIGGNKARQTIVSHQPFTQFECERAVIIHYSIVTSKCYTLSKSTALRPLKVGVSFIAWEAIMTVEASLNGYCYRMVASRATN